MQRVEKPLLYVIGGLCLAFLIANFSGWSPSRADDVTDWMTLAAYSVLAASTIGGVIYWLLTRRRKDDFKPWTPKGGKAVDGWTPPAGWKGDPYEGRED